MFANIGVIRSLTWKWKPPCIPLGRRVIRSGPCVTSSFSVLVGSKTLPVWMKWKYVEYIENKNKQTTHDGHPEYIEDKHDDQI